MIEKGKSKTAPAETASVKVLRNNLQERKDIITRGLESSEHESNTSVLHKIPITDMQLKDKWHA